MILALFGGIIYGLVIGLIPAAGATTGLVALFPFAAALTAVDPYLAVIFIVAVVASSTTGDTFASVLLGIPGANSSGATMVDGFPLAKQGKASYALTAAITTSTFNGMIWGSLTFLFLPYYHDFIILPASEGGVGQAELFALCVLAFVTVGFISTASWIKSLIGLSIGVFLALVGTDPITAAPRFTGGWDFLIGDGTGKGISLVPIIAGIFAMPEMLIALKANFFLKRHNNYKHSQQVIDGIKISFKEWKLSLRGGLIGGIIGFLPGLGGGVSDWLAYGQTVATNPNEKIPFGEGNIKGVIGPEGSNNAQKATSFIPTVLFGIPGAPFAAIIIGLFSVIGFDLSLDTANIMRDEKFFDSMTFAFLGSTLITGIICISLMKYITAIAYIPYKYYFPVIALFVGWAVWVSGFGIYGLESVILLLMFTVLGLGMKTYGFSRPALMIGFILGDKIELLYLQFMNLFNVGGYALIRLIQDKPGQGRLNISLAEGKDVLQHPAFVVISILIIIVLIYSYRNKGNINYA
jgi:TctA family transporter